MVLEPTVAVGCLSRWRRLSIFTDITVARREASVIDPSESQLLSAL
jgi:hypothetical protein